MVIAAIPQITRDKLASSVVGTPGVDTSGQKIESSLAEGAQGVGQAIGEYAINRQQELDQASANQGMVDYKMATINSVEQIKKDYADNPQDANQALAKVMQTNLSNSVAQATNPRDALLRGRGDPGFDGFIGRQLGDWASNQEYQNVIKGATDTINTLSSKAGDIGRDSTLTPQQALTQMNSLASTLGNQVASIKNSRHPELAPEVTQKGLQSMARGLFGGRMDIDPAGALALLNTDGMKEMFNPQQLDEMKQGAQKAMVGFAAKQKWDVISADLIQHPELVQNIINGKPGSSSWMDIDNMQKYDMANQSHRSVVGLATDPKTMDLKQQTYGFLKELTLQHSPEESVPEQANAHDALINEAHSIGVNVPKKTPTDNVESLLTFSNHLIDARVRGVIFPEEFGLLHDKVASPLTAAVMKRFDPQGFDRITSAAGSWWQKTWGDKDPNSAVNRFAGGVESINNYMSATGQKDDNVKRTLLNNYLGAMDGKIGNPSALDNQGRPYTPSSVAAEILGIRLGDMIKTKYGMRAVNGYVKAGVPTYEKTPEDDALDANKAALAALRKTQ